MFKTRLISGIVILALMIGLFSAGGIVLLVGLCAISMCGYLELTWVLDGLETNRRPDCRQIIGLITIACYYVVLYLNEHSVLLYMYLLAGIMVQLFFFVFTYPKFSAYQIVSSAFALIYVPVMLSYIYLTRAFTVEDCKIGFYLVWMIIISSWGCDTCAYCAGMLFGKHKIFPTLSPKKTLEGCIGGVIGAAAIAFLCGELFINPANNVEIHPLGLALICAVGALMSMVGDLAASAFKRAKGVKDYGKLIPGHGGIMDRFDSMIVTAPATYMLTYLFIYVI